MMPPLAPAAEVPDQTQGPENRGDDRRRRDRDTQRQRQDVADDSIHRRLLRSRTGLRVPGRKRKKRERDGGSDESFIPPAHALLSYRVGSRPVCLMDLHADATVGAARCRRPRLAPNVRWPSTALNRRAGVLVASSDESAWWSVVRWSRPRPPGTRSALWIAGLGVRRN